MTSKDAMALKPLTVIYWMDFENDESKELIIHSSRFMSLVQENPNHEISTDDNVMIAVQSDIDGQIFIMEPDRFETTFEAAVLTQRKILQQNQRFCMDRINYYNKMADGYEKLVTDLESRYYDLIYGEMKN